jgi:hypothetical protein
MVRNKVNEFAIEAANSAEEAAANSHCTFGNRIKHWLGVARRNGNDPLDLVLLALLNMSRQQHLSKHPSYDVL